MLSSPLILWAYITKPRTSQGVAMFWGATIPRSYSRAQWSKSFRSWSRTTGPGSTGTLLSKRPALISLPSAHASIPPPPTQSLSSYPASNLPPPSILLILAPQSGQTRQPPALQGIIVVAFDTYNLGLKNTLCATLLFLIRPHPHSSLSLLVTCFYFTAGATCRPLLLSHPAHFHSRKFSPSINPFFITLHFTPRP